MGEAAEQLTCPVAIVFDASARPRRYDIYVRGRLVRGHSRRFRRPHVDGSTANSRGLLLARRTRMDYLTPQDVLDEARAVAIRKASLPTAQLLLRGAIAGGILAYATSLAMVVNAQSLPPIVAAI